MSVQTFFLLIGHKISPAFQFFVLFWNESS